MNLPIPSPTLARLNPHLFSGGQSVVSCGEPVTRESDLHESIFAECRKRGWIALHGSMSERTHRTAGEPDFVILANAGRVLLVECKSREGKLSPTQSAMKAHAEKLCHTVHVVRSMDEFFKIL
jgi:Holliday junction resolvase-like predicted endonuclease